MSNIAYSASWSLNVAAVSSAQSNLSILSAGRDIKIKSAYIGIQISDLVTGLKIPWENTTEDSITVTIGVGAPIALPFRAVGGSTPIFNGGQIYIYEPGQYFFDAFYISNECFVNMQVDNLALINNHVYQISLIIETEQKTKFL